ASPARLIRKYPGCPGNSAMNNNRPLPPSARGFFSVSKLVQLIRVRLQSAARKAASHPTRDTRPEKRKLRQSLTLSVTRAIVAGNAGSPQQLRHGDVPDNNTHMHIYATSGPPPTLTTP